jgi:hypothetical protein
MNELALLDFPMHSGRSLLALEQGFESEVLHREVRTMHVKHITIALLVGLFFAVAGAGAFMQDAKDGNQDVEQIIGFADRYGTTPLTEQCRTLLRERIKFDVQGPLPKVVADADIKKCLGGKYSFLGTVSPLGTGGIDMGSLVVDESVMYVKIPEFKKGTAQAFVGHLEEHPVNALIIDLRGTPGGSVDEALGILDQFVPKPGEVTISTTGAERNTVYHGDVGKAWRAVHGAFIVIMVDEDTASAAEILAGVLKHWYPDRVVLLGLGTYGKGTYQDVGRAGPYWFAVPAGRWYVGEGSTRTSVEGVGLQTDWQDTPTLAAAFQIITLRRALEVEAAKRNLVRSMSCTAVRERKGETVCR